MYLLGVKPWESAKWVVPSLEEMSGKVRRDFEEMNPEVAINREPAGQGVIGDHGVDEQRETKEEL